MYATTKEMKTMPFRINNWNTKKAIGIQVTCITERRLQKELILAKKTLSFRPLMCPFRTPVRMETYIRMPRLRN